MTTAILGMTIPLPGASSDVWGNNLNDDLALIDTFAGKLMPGAEVTVASASTCDIGAAASTAVAISGTSTITSFGSSTNTIRFVRFTGALTLTHNASNLILLGGANRTTAAGDTGIYKSDGSGNWREYAFNRANGSGQFAGQVSTSAGGFLDSSGAGYVQSSFGTTSTWGANGVVQSSGSPTSYSVIARTNGVILNDGGTSWTAISERAKKKDLQDIPGDPFAIIAAHETKLGRYLGDAQDVPLRPFLFYEDAVQAYPWATVTIEERTMQGDDGSVHVMPAYNGLSLEQYVPLLMAAFKQQIQINAALTARVHALEAA